MIPLGMADAGSPQIVKKIGGSADVRLHLETLGFHVGGEVTVVSALAGNLIVKVKESRVALDEALARKIMV
ncbi:MAG: ferrous iron transport protein A [Clostridia bacterium]|nr:ferrous iron transport protein A [Clostridia bacterium]